MQVRRPSSPASHIKWLIPGMGLKRWLLLLALGAAVLGLGLVYSLVVLYRAQVLPLQVYRLLTLQFLQPTARAIAAILVGITVTVSAVFGLSRSVITPFLETKGAALADLVYEYRRRDRGPRVVAIGGGTGLSNLLRGLKRHTNHITAIITVADDGGSSGRLRRELGLPPPGDFRNCIAALADDEALTTQLFQYRFGFPGGGLPPTGGEVSGHSFGNLFIAAMTGVTGSFESGLEQSSRVLAVQGRILPSTLANVTLVADVREQTVRRITGESHIPKAQGVIERVHLTPEHAPAYPAAVRAILTADVVVLGPGSLFTSVLPNLLVHGIRQALATTRAPVVYVCNVAHQAGETAGFDSDAHLEGLERHIGRGIIDVMLVDNAVPPAESAAAEQHVRLGTADHLRVMATDLIDWQQPRMHDGGKLAKAILSLL